MSVLPIVFAGPPPAIVGWLGLFAAIGLTIGAAEIVWRKYGPDKPNSGRRRDRDSDTYFARTGDRDDGDTRG